MIAKGLGQRKRSQQQLVVPQRRAQSLLNGLLVLGLLAVLLIFWRALGRPGQGKLAAGEALFLRSGADLGQDGGEEHKTGGNMFAGKAVLHAPPHELSQLHRLQNGERAHAAVAQAAAGPAKGKSMGFYWGMKGESEGSKGDSSSGKVSLQHLQKVSEASAKQGKTTSGFYFSQDIPENLKADAAADDVTSQHRKDLRTTTKDGDPKPLGYYFQKDAHHGGLKGASVEVHEGAPEAKPLKYYFTKDISDDAKRQLAFKAMMRAQMEGTNDTQKLSHQLTLP